MTNTITGNEDQPEDNKIPEKNLEKDLIEKYGPEEGRRRYNQAIRSKINLAEIREKKKKRLQELAAQDELREKKRQILQRNYAQNNAQNGDSGKPIDLSEIRQKKRQIQKQKELEEEIVLPFTVSRPEDEEEQTLPFSIDREEAEEGVLPFSIGYAQPEGEAERLDEVLGKEERIAQYGITSKELRSRPVLLEFQTSDGKKEVYSWIAAAEKDYALLEQMSCFEAVGYILARAPLKKTDGKLPDAEGKERLRLEKSLLEGEDFGITTEDSGALLPEGKGKYTIGGKPSPDERQRPLLEYLRSGKDSKGRDVWHQRFGVCLSFSLDELANE